MDSVGYPEGALERLQQVELQTLVDVDKVCRENGITYFLDGGTCLGAVRHKGFIPWDDDADIAMPLEDYKRFVQIAPKALSPDYTLSSCGDTENLSAMWTKVSRKGTKFLDQDSRTAGYEGGIYLDVFPYIRLDKSEKIARKQFKSTQLWQKMAYVHFLKDPAILKNAPSYKRFGYAIAHSVVSHLWSAKSLKRHFQKYFETQNPSDTWINPSAARWYPHKDETLFPVTEVVFEGAKVFAPHDCDAYLTTVYGDYMKIPAPEDRHVHQAEYLDFGDGRDAMESS